MKNKNRTKKRDDIKDADNIKNKKANKRLVINKQKIFCFISIIFVLVCIFWYGGRFVYFYLSSKEEISNEKKILATTIINNNSNADYFKKIGSDYYFYGDSEDNYLVYSNMLFRIVKIDRDNKITLVSDSPVTDLVYGKDKDFDDNFLIKWLNYSKNDSTGILEGKLNDKEKYLVKTKTCIDKISNVKDIGCKNVNDSYYLSLMSMVDYVNTGAEESFINNGYYTYLANMNGDEVWYISDSGKLNTSDGMDIWGVKTTLTLDSNVSPVSGDGTLNNPYIIEEKNGYFGGYVKLGEDIWRIYEDGDILKLVLNDYLKVNGKNLEYIYSYGTYFHNDTKYSSLAYYLNNKFFNSLEYKDLLVSNNYSNYFYGDENEYDFETTILEMVDTKIANLSIGDVMLNSNLDGYFTSTGTGKDKNEIYVVKKNGTVVVNDTDTEALVVPVISIRKDSLKLGSGTSNDPYRTE